MLSTSQKFLANQGYFSSRNMQRDSFYAVLEVLGLKSLLIYRNYISIFATNIRKGTDR